MELPKEMLPRNYCAFPCQWSEGYLRQILPFKNHPSQLALCFDPYLTKRIALQGLNAMSSRLQRVKRCAVKFIWALGNNGLVRFWIQSCCKSRSLKRVICCQSEKESRPRLFRTLTPPKASKVAARLAKTWHLPTHTVWRCVWKFGQKSISKMAKTVVGGVAHYQGKGGNSGGITNRKAAALDRASSSENWLIP